MSLQGVAFIKVHLLQRVRQVGRSISGANGRTFCRVVPFVESYLFQGVPFIEF